MASPAPAVPRLTYLRIKNYRALRDVEFRDLTPLTVLIGPNGSGKSTVLDALDFLAEAVRGNMQKAWEKRDRFRGMRTRGSDGNIEFEVEFFMSLAVPRLRYKLEIDEALEQVFVSTESLTEPGAELERIIDWVDVEPSPQGLDFRINIYERDGNPGRYYPSPSSYPIIHFTYAFPERRIEQAPKTLALANILASYRLFHFIKSHKGYSDAGPREKLSPDGENLPNVLYYLHEKHSDVLQKITAQLRRWVPQLADIVTEITSDERLLLRFKDEPFEKPFAAKYISDGTMRLACIFAVLYEPNATGIVGMEEPENELHPLLLYRLAEELSKASETRQLLVSTHSSMLLDALEPTQVWVLHRGADGYTQATRTADIPNVPELVEDGSPLGYLWTSNAFTVGNPLASFHPRPDAR